MLRRRHFQYQHPRFGSGRKPRPPSGWERSVYYWWWEYLRRHVGYRRCCERGGVGAYSALYRDFGDVHATDFKAWWSSSVGGRERGVVLFAEPNAPLELREIGSSDEWDTSWSAETVLVAAVPLSQSKRHLQRRFAALLAKRHKGRRGRPNTKTSAAKYPVYRKFSVPALRQMLAVYDLRKAEAGLTLAEIGQRLRLVKRAMPSKGDTPKDAAAKRNVLNTTVGRYLKHAAAIIANTGRGNFPQATQK